LRTIFDIAVDTNEEKYINLANNKELGTYMTNATFFTLYHYLSDPPGKGISTCYETGHHFM